MQPSRRFTEKAALAGAGVLAAGALVLGGTAWWNGLRGPEVTTVKETRKIAKRGTMLTNVVCGEGRRAVGGGHAFHGTYNVSEPVSFPVSAPESTSDRPGAVQNAWEFVVQNPTAEEIDVELYAICVPAR
ncbi:hypothetical protein AB0D67_18585 [Streptosporangium sp. NPDC048047]|uniref:hypothetical protein n=1 Tax=Streptosporangium sp. NPDC048047 TaxID=3155748 RepID=UPI00343620FE